jgi:hypothetical protein
MISAEAHSDDFNVERSFDATPWFEQASGKKILDLAKCGFGGDYPADNVAEFMSYYLDNRGDGDLKELFTYLGIIANDPVKKDCHGFECHVDPEEARAWIKEHRPILDGAYEAS